MRKTTQLFLTTALMLAGSNTLKAQNLNTPYSVYGVGDIDTRAYNRTSGMASTGLALNSSFYIIDNNPASLTGLPKSFFVIDAFTVGRSVKYSGDPIDLNNSSNKDFWIKRLGLTFKMTNHWASGIGFKQFININYKYTGTKAVEGTTAVYNAAYEGDGGLNEYYWTNAVSLGKHLSLGLKTAILAGPINQTETITDDALSTDITTTQKEYYGHVRLQAGALYHTPLTKKWDFSIGGKYIPQTKLVGERTVTVTENTTQLVNEESIVKARMYIPTTYAAGLALRSNKKTTYAVDYTYDDWSSLKIKESGWQLVSSDRLSAGVEFVRNQFIQNQIMEKRYFQLGAFMHHTYLQIRNQPINEYGITAGMGGVLSNVLLYSFSAEVGRRGTTQESLIRENYVQVTLGVSFRDFLMSKGRKYD